MRSSKVLVPVPFNKTFQIAWRSEVLGKEGYPKARRTVLLGELAMLLGGEGVPQSSAGYALRWGEGTSKLSWLSKKLSWLCSEVSWLCFEVGGPYSEVGYPSSGVGTPSSEVGGNFVFD